MIKSNYLDGANNIIKLKDNHQNVYDCMKIGVKFINIPFKDIECVIILVKRNELLLFQNATLQSTM